MLMRFSCLLAAAALLSCTGESSLDDLPTSTGSVGDVLLIMDSTQWRGDLGAAIEEVFHEELKGLPREEPVFNLHFIEPSRFNRILRTNRNLIFALTLDGKTPGARTVRRFLTKESLDRIRQDTSLYVYTVSNMYARGQEVIYLLGRTEEELARRLRANRQKLQDFLNTKERERLSGTLFSGESLKGLPQILDKACKCSLRIPYGYKFVMDTEDFLWLRRIDTEADRSIFITWKHYRDTSMFSTDSLIALRNNVAARYLFEDPELPDSYLTTETSIPFRPVTTRRTRLNNEFAVEMRGLWRTNLATMGGPFLGYSTADPSAGRLYYIEGFLYSPGRQQREIMREIEATLHTFRYQPTTPKTP
jgi:hypothetical protein